MALLVNLLTPVVLGLWERFPRLALCTRASTTGSTRMPSTPLVFIGLLVFLASRLKIPRISVIELGVAGGRGLVALERASAEIEKALGVGIDVVGFDTGEGMPAAADYRDLPHIWGPGFYKMDADKLRARLTRAELILGDVAATTTEWMRRPKRAPIGFVSVRPRLLQLHQRLSPCSRGWLPRICHG